MTHIGIEGRGRRIEIESSLRAGTGRRARSEYRRAWISEPARSSAVIEHMIRRVDVRHPIIRSRTRAARRSAASRQRPVDLVRISLRPANRKRESEKKRASKNRPQ